MFVIRWSVCPWQPFQPSQIFVSKAGSYPSGAHFKCSAIGQAPGLIYKRWIRLESTATDRHSSLLQKFVNYGWKMFFNIWPWCQCFKYCFLRQWRTKRPNKIECLSLSNLFPTLSNIRGMVSSQLYTGRLWPYLQIIDKAGLGCMLQTL
jgi:hypothetical protein